MESRDDSRIFERHVEYHSPGYLITVSYEFTLISKDFVSLISNSYSYTGGAHGNYGTLGYSYSLNPLIEFNAQSFINYGYTYQYISDYCRKFIADRIKLDYGDDANLSDFILNEGPLKPELGNFKNFFLDKEGVNFIFNPYEITSYALDQHVINIPYSKLLEIESNSAILKKLVEVQAIV